ncbi:MAG TPA: NUDIX domain-containing protein [Povalibacter sp.]|jgi:8-oxo-dGTP pyrophosphatase MutT (NUDIX family)
MSPRLTRLSAGVVVVRDTPDGWRFLLLRAFNHWDFPKGMVEAGEEPLAAAIREVREESLIDDLEFLWGEDHLETGPYSRGKVARYYIARTRTTSVSLPVIEELGRPEHNEYRWVDRDAALKLISPRIEPVLEWACSQIDGAETSHDQAGSPAQADDRT